MTNVAKCIIVSFKVIKISFQSIFTACLHMMHIIVAVAIMDRMSAINRKKTSMSVYYYHYSLFSLILASFVDIDRQNPLESLVLPVIQNQNQIFVMKLVGLAPMLCKFVKYGFLNYWLKCENNA